MGVPGFYRWAVRKVRDARKRIDAEQPPEFDNVYLDFNGVVHGCINEWTGNEDLNELFQRIEEQLWILLSVVRPLALLVIALDGVAPRAKLNQQRSRRFRSARDAEAAANTSEGAGAGSFDRNAVTPGTDFMVRLCSFLEEWAARAVLQLQGVTIVVSGDRDPGEGEHKIMSIIRRHPERSHILFSNDADLIFLGLVSPAESVHLLRVKPENARRTQQPAKHTKRPTPASAAYPSSEVPADVAVPADGPEQHGDGGSAAAAEAAGGTAMQDGAPPADPAAAVAAAEHAGDYELVDIVAVRRWLASQYPDHSAQRLGIDFVAICCLAGNDFLPAIDVVSIYNDGLDRALYAYSRVLPVQGHLVGESLDLHLPAWQALLRMFSELEAESLLETARLGLGSGGKPYRGPCPPTEAWDGLSVRVTRAPHGATAEDVQWAMEKAGKGVVTSVHALRGRGKGKGKGSGTSWLVRFAEPTMAVKALTEHRRLWNTPMVVEWADTNTCEFEAPCEEAFERVDWSGAVDAAVMECFEYWFSQRNLLNDDFLRRQIRTREDRFVPIEVFTRFNRLKTLCQDPGRLASAARRSDQLEVEGEGGEAVVRARTDYSELPGETAEDVAAGRRALASVGRRDFVSAGSELKKIYYRARQGPTVSDAPAQDDWDATDRHRCSAFLAGIQWVVLYYMRGCPSWSWFYPAVYPPTCAGMSLRAAEPVELPPLCEPFPPLLQLLAVLPPHSAALLPETLQPLLTDPDSALSDFYPRSFDVDRKENEPEWHGVVLLPFIEEERLRAEAGRLMPDAVVNVESHPARAFVAEHIGRDPAWP